MPLPLRRALATGLGQLAYALRIRRRITLDNLREAFPEKSEAECRAIAKRAYVNLAHAALEALTSVGMTPEEIARSVVIENWAPLEESIRSGQGVLIATAHFGSWELLGEVMAQKNFRLNAVVRPLKGALNAKIIENRVHAGLGLIPPRGAIQQTVKALRRGEVVAMLIDQVLPKKSAVWVPFFGRPAATNPALSAAALRTGSPVFVVMGAREKHGLRMYVEGPFPVPSNEDRDQAIAEHTAQVTEVLERYIRQYPDQWMWPHRRWKSVTTG